MIPLETYAAIIADGAGRASVDWNALAAARGKKSCVVDMSRWVTLEALEGLFVKAAKLSGACVPKLVDSLTKEGWSRDQDEQTVACVVVSDALVSSLASVPPAVAVRVAAQWAKRLGPPADDSVRYPLRVRAMVER